MTRVTLTAELKVGLSGNTVYFLGEFEGSPVKVEVYGAVDVLHVRRALAAHGSVTFDSPTYRIDPATEADRRATDPEHIPLSDDERMAIVRLASLKRLGILKEGAA